MRRRQPPGPSGRAGPEVPEPTDGQLLRAAERDPAAFGHLYDRHAEDLHRWLLNQGVGDVAGADLLAELFAQAWISRQRFRDDGDGNARPWLFGIARNLLAAYRRKDRVATGARVRLGVRLGVGTDPSDPCDEVADRLDAAAAGPALGEALASLPPGQRAAVGLRVVDGLPYGEVAAALDCTDVTARKRVSQGLRALRLKMGATP
jgi:RNA polymerase sigma-70 factor (ECF subfamily)